MHQRLRSTLWWLFSIVGVLAIVGVVIILVATRGGLGPSTVDVGRRTSDVGFKTQKGPPSQEDPL